MCLRKLFGLRDDSKLVQEKLKEYPPLFRALPYAPVKTVKFPPQIYGKEFRVEVILTVESP